MKLNERKILASKYGNCLLTFYRIMINKYPFYNVNHLTKMLNDLEISATPTRIKEFIVRHVKLNHCSYSPEDNKMLLINNNVKEYYIYHELFHMFSTYLEKNTIYSGFSQTDRKTYESFGVGLNEGYTQLLKERYFGIDRKETYHYMLEKHIAKHLEVIIGRKLMEKMYAEANLQNLVYQLSQYYDEEKVIKFLANVDYLNSNASTPDYHDDINQKLKETLMFLLNVYVKKQTLLYSKGLLDKEQYKGNIETYLRSLSSSLYYKEYFYNALSYKDVKDVFYDTGLMSGHPRR